MTKMKTFSRLALAVLTVWALSACQTRDPNPQRSAANSTQLADGTPGVGNAAPVAGGGAPARATPLPTRSVQVEDTITVDGVLAASLPVVTVGFETNGRVTSVRALAGQVVKRGEVLAELDVASLQEAVLVAQEQLALKRANIANSLLPASTTDIKTAESSLASSYAAYNEAKKGPTSLTLEQALRSLNQSKNSLYSAQLSRDQVCRLRPGVSDSEYVARAKLDPDCKSADLNVEQSELRLRNAEQQYADAQKPPSKADIARAWSNVVQAQTNLAKLKRGVSAEQKAVYDLQLKQSEIAVARAERALKKSQLLSPCDCVVQTVPLSVGALATGGVTLLDMTRLQFQTTNLSERDVIGLAPGQPVSVRLKAFDRSFTGAVNAVLPQTSGALNGTALYTALVILDAPDPALLPGMTGQAEIKVK